MAEADVVSDAVQALAGFAGALRERGVRADSSRLADTVKALSYLDPTREADLYWAGRFTLCAERDDLASYDAVFDEWFGGHARARTEPAADQVRLAELWSPKSTGAVVGDEASSPHTVTASDLEVLQQRDLSELDANQVDEVNRLLSLLEPKVAPRRTRRRQPGNSRPIDVNRTVRGMMRDGGELRTLARLTPTVRPRRLVFLIDISGSMSPYADVLLRFAHAAVRTSPTATEVFTVGTQLTRLTTALRCRDADDAQRAAALAIPDWSGGTRLGESLQAFLDLWGQRGTARQAVVVIASDGWERGDAALLGEQMARLRRLAHRILWLNPHAGRDGFVPATAGMTVALPYIDDLLAAHTFEALRELTSVIARA